MKLASRSPLHFAALLALMLSVTVSAQDAMIQRQQKAPTVAAPLAARSQSTVEDRYRQRAGIVIEMTPSPQRQAVATPKR